MSFTTLTGDIQVYLERGGSAQTDPTVFNQIPRLINASERKLATALKLLGQIEVLTDSNAGLQQGNPIVTKPDRWRQTVSLTYLSGTARKPLFERSYEYLTTLWPDSSVIDNDEPPGFYADIDLLHWYVAPTPPSDFPLQIIAYFQPPLLDEANQTNFWTDYTPQLLLYGALLEATPFLKDDPRIQIWGQSWAQELQMHMAADLQRLLDRASERKTP